MLQDVQIDPLKKAEATERQSAAKAMEANAKAEAQRTQSAAKVLEAHAKADAQQRSIDAKLAERQATADMQAKAHQNKLAMENAKTRNSYLSDLLERRRVAAESTPQAVSGRLQGLFTGTA
ncbi:MAG: hypothetical protein EBR82_19005 [Caulobacteraceae bacterium]|nr:hypothetical protein [Caulobacteraceae bacterium]